MTKLLNSVRFLPPEWIMKLKYMCGNYYDRDPSDQQITKWRNNQLAAAMIISIMVVNGFEVRKDSDSPWWICGHRQWKKALKSRREKLCYLFKKLGKFMLITYHHFPFPTPSLFSQLLSKSHCLFFLLFV